MIQNAARRFCNGFARAGTIGCGHMSPGGRRIFADDTESFRTGEDEFNGADDDAAKGIGDRRREASGAGGLLRDEREAIKIQIEASHGSNEISTTAIQRAVESIGVFHVRLNEVIFELGGGDVETPVGN